MIELTVGMPIISSKHVAWIALESLCHQKDINFDWELIIMEENNQLKVGFDAILKYRDALMKVGCRRILYYPLGKWITLGEKYVWLNNLQSNSSKIFMLQDGDVYSPDRWLRLARDAYPFGWFCSTKGYYYNIFSKRMAIHTPGNPDQASIYNGMDAVCWSNLDHRLYEKKMYCNGWLYDLIKEKMGNSFTRDTQFWDNWKTGVNMHGFNVISKGRSKSIDGKSNLHLWSGCHVDLYDIIPEDIHSVFKYHIEERIADVNKNGDHLKLGKLELVFDNTGNSGKQEVLL